MRTFLNHIKNETLDEIKTLLENLWQWMIQLPEFFQYSFVPIDILKRKCLVGASRVRFGESGTPSIHDGAVGISNLRTWVWCSYGQHDTVGTQRCRGRLVPRSAATLLVQGAHSNWLWKLSSMTALPETCQNSLKFHLHILCWEQSVPKTIELTSHLGQWQALIYWPKPGFSGPNDWHNTMSREFPHASRASGRALFTGPIGNWLANGIGPVLI